MKLIKNIEKECGILYNYVKNSLIKGITYMKPRIFISSTFYDLKHIREDIANFVRSYGYEPILFEDGDIGYTPGNTLDSSCYETMKNSDMVILIIGGEYGSPASGEKKDDFKEYISVTRNEFRTAIDSGIPVFAMIDKNVMAEYRMYEANYDLIEKEKKELNFVATKNVNIFRFIKEVKGIVTLPVQEVEKPSEIKGFICKQWADMFKNYLGSLRNEKENRKIESSVNEMKALIQKMNIMLDRVGKNVLSKENSNEYDEVVNQQEIISFCNSILEVLIIDISKNIQFDYDNCSEIIITKFLNKLIEVNNMGIFEDILFKNDDKWGDMVSILSNDPEFNVYYESSKSINELREIYDKIYLLLNDESIKKVKEVMLRGEYFNRLVVKFS